MLYKGMVLFSEGMPSPAFPLKSSTGCNAASITKIRFFYLDCAPTAAVNKIVFQNKDKDPFEFCMNLVELIRKDLYVDKAQKCFYKSLINQIEEYMCALLDQVQFVLVDHCSRDCPSG